MEFENPKLFVGKISVKTDEATLIQHFSKYGEVKHALTIYDKRIGFVTFSDPLMAKNALQEEYIILGKKVDVEPAKPKVQISNRKIFVGGLPSTITLEEFKEYFGSYSTITDAVVIYDKESHIVRGFGFVTYDSKEAADDVLRKNFPELNDKMAEVKRAKPKEKMRKNTDCHDYGSAPLPVPCCIYGINPGFNLPGGGYCCYHYPCFPVQNGYETGFRSYPAWFNLPGGSYSGAPDSNWINWRTT